MKTRLEFPELLISKCLTGEGAEIGVLFGEYSAHILANWPGRLHLVDPWENQDPEIYTDGCNAVSMRRAFEKARAATVAFGDRANLIREYSTEASLGFREGQLDFVYLDGNHAYGSVVNDIAGWWPRVRAGGILAGHDYYNRNDDYQQCGVMAAVNAFISITGLKLHLTRDDAPLTWWVEKP